MSLKLTLLKNIAYLGSLKHLVLMRPQNNLLRKKIHQSKTRDTWSYRLDSFYRTQVSLGSSLWVVFSYPVSSYFHIQYQLSCIVLMSRNICITLYCIILSLSHCEGDKTSSQSSVDAIDSWIANSWIAQFTVPTVFPVPTGPTVPTGSTGPTWLIWLTNNCLYMTLSSHWLAHWLTGPLTALTTRRCYRI